MTDTERQIMHDHHIAMRRTCLAQAAEHEKMAKAYEEKTETLIPSTPDALSAFRKLSDPALTPGQLIRLTKAEFAEMRQFQRVTINTPTEEYSVEIQTV